MTSGLAATAYPEGARTLQISKTVQLRYTLAEFLNTQEAL